MELLWNIIVLIVVGAIAGFIARAVIPGKQAMSVGMTILLGPAAVRALVGMGPHARHRSPSELAAAVAALPEPVQVTVAVRLGTYRRRASDAGTATVPGVPTAR